MATVEQHQAAVRALLTPALDALAAAPEQVDLPAAAGRTLARDAYALLPIPAFTNSQMDGYAVQLPVRPGTLLPQGTTTAAGDAPLDFEPGTAMPVMTGAPVPAGADAVIPVEQTVSGRFGPLFRAGQQPVDATVQLEASAEPGQFIRPAGSQLEAGTLLAAAGTRITPALLGSLAAAGLSTLEVRPHPRVLLCTTGDELAEPGQASAPGTIPDANSPMLAAWLEEHGATVQRLRLPDDPQRFAAQLPGEADLVITVGGISAGAFEVVRQALAQSGTFGHVDMQPGGPQGLAELGGVPVLCFPGNPVSALLSAQTFLAPLLREYHGIPEPRPMRLPLAHDVDSPAAKHQIRRASIIDGQLHILHPGSHMIHDLATADALVHFPVGVASVPAGTILEAWSFND